MSKPIERPEINDVFGVPFEGPEEERTPDPVEAPDAETESVEFSLDGDAKSRNSFLPEDRNFGDVDDWLAENLPNWREFAKKRAEAQIQKELNPPLDRGRATILVSPGEFQQITGLELRDLTNEQSWPPERNEAWRDLQSEYPGLLEIQVPFEPVKIPLGEVGQVRTGGTKISLIFDVKGDGYIEFIKKLAAERFRTGSTLSLQLSGSDRESVSLDSLLDLEVDV
jgi:hypothetical protein